MNNSGRRRRSVCSSASIFMSVKIARSRYRGELGERNFECTSMSHRGRQSAAGTDPIGRAVLGEEQVHALGGDAGHGPGRADVFERTQAHPGLFHGFAPRAGFRRIVLDRSRR